ncbi:hypothetical protein [Hyphomicrobium sulfonivorans]|nr:hypothetical protein [Hyphomicrobium sulfonivorans]
MEPVRHQLMIFIGKKFRDAMKGTCADPLSPSIALALDKVRQLEKSMRSGENGAGTVTDGEA